MKQAIESGFFNAQYDEATGTYDREYSSAQFRELFSLFFTNGIFVNYGEEFFVEATNSLSINVGSGFGFINGSWSKNPDTISFSIPANTTGVIRTDGVFLQSSILERDCFIVYKEGDVTPVQSSVETELLLCTITVPSGASSINQAQITDMRATDKCGFVGGAVQQMSVSGLYAQFTEQFTQWMEAEQEDFEDWFDGIKNRLSTDQAGSLQLQIDDLDTKVDNVATATNTSIELLKTTLATFNETTGTLTFNLDI